MRKSNHDARMTGNGVPTIGQGSPRSGNAGDDPSGEFR